ncbi:MAG: hypothetical protein BWY28_02736 [bacterium ADurb.Bin236]|nr:MAG: hypothetical protein BWY28_02736 [bacterium ADurb.Bin236]
MSAVTVTCAEASYVSFEGYEAILPKESTALTVTAFATCGVLDMKAFCSTVYVPVAGDASVIVPGVADEAIGFTLAIDSEKFTAESSS